MRAIIANFVKGVVRLWLATENVNNQLGKLGFIYPKTFVLVSNMKPLEIRTLCVERGCASICLYKAV